jgi:hypothetical protein
VTVEILQSDSSFMHHLRLWRPEVDLDVTDDDVGSTRDVTTHRGYTQITRVLADRALRPGEAPGTEPPRRQFGAGQPAVADTGRHRRRLLDVSSNVADGAFIRRYRMVRDGITGRG